MKPILFNTEMVKAILDGRKTVTRRIIKPQPRENAEMRYVFAGGRNSDIGKWHDWQQGVTEAQKWNPPFHADDILYVRETWGYNRDSWLYKANYKEDEWDLFRWHPSIHMPKKVARIFLRVKCVSVERLQDITVEQVAAEGIDNAVPCDDAEELCNYCPLPDESKGVHCYGGNVHMCEGSHCKEALEYWEEEFIGEFAGLWESTIKDKDIATYGWDANPWVWVIEFEKISKEEALKC